MPGLLLRNGNTAAGNTSQPTKRQVVPLLADVPWTPSAFVATVAPAGQTATITGTATASIDETDIVAGGKTIIITLTGTTWIP